MAKKKSLIAAISGSLDGWGAPILLGVGIFLLMMPRNSNAQNNQTNQPSVPDTNIPPNSGTSNVPQVSYTQEQLQLNLASIDTVKAAQTRINMLLDFFRDFGSEQSMWWASNVSLPANLNVDGVIGNLTKNAIKYVICWAYNITHTDKKAPSDITWDVATISYFTLNNYILGIYQQSIQ